MVFCCVLPKFNKHQGAYRVLAINTFSISSTFVSVVSKENFNYRTGDLIEVYAFRCSPESYVAKAIVFQFYKYFCKILNFTSVKNIGILM